MAIQTPVMHSKISICNNALGLLGEASIRSFNDGNIRARMCELQYDIAVEALLTRIDWPFARTSKRLLELSLPDDEKIQGKHHYALPPDCIIPRWIDPQSGLQDFFVAGSQLVTRLKPVTLIYTRLTAEDLFSPMFVHTLSLALAIRIGPALTQDKILVSSLKNLFEYELANAMEIEANTDNVYRAYDETPENDRFVTP